MLKNFSNKKLFNKTAFTISMFYCLLSFLWIYYSDKLLLIDPETSLYISTLKGFIYTLVVSVFIYFAIFVGFNKKVEAQEKFRRLFESSKFLIILFDFETNKIIDINNFVFNFIGYTPDELIGRNILEVEFFVDVKRYREKINELKENNYSESSDLHFRTKSGFVRYGDSTSNILFINNRKIIQCYVQDVTERTELNKAKLDFLSIASHQLRTPLSINKWVLDSLSGTDLDGKQREKFNDLVVSNERLIVLVNDFLKVALIETGKLKVNKKLINIIDTVNDVVNSLKVLSLKKDKNIKIDIPSNLEYIYCDPVLIHEVLENLVNNAIFYSEKDSKEISIKLVDRGIDYLISVHNEGLIDSVFGDSIESFGKFVRGPSSSETEPAGSGLGLFITRKMVEASGGNVWFESDVKSGTTFYLTIIKNKL